MGLPLGRYADTRNRRNLIAAGILIWSALTAACSSAKNFWSLFVTRTGVGVGEATLSPAAFSLITDYFPTSRLGIALSIYSMGIFVGSGLALIVGGTVVQMLSQIPFLTVPFLGAIASWRVTFLIVGVPGLLMALLVFTIREPQRRHLLRATDGSVSKLNLKEVWDQVRARLSSVLGISLGMVFQSACSYAFLAWGPAFLQRSHGWTTGHAGRTLGILTLLCGCLGMFLGGTLCDYWQRLGIREAPLRVGVVSAVGTGILLPIAILAGNTAWMTTLLVPALLFLALPIGSSYAALQLIFPNQVRGQVSALFLFILSLGGLTLGPLLPGLLSDYFFHSEKMLGPSLAITVASASILMFVAFLMTYRSYREHHRVAFTQELH